MLDFLCAIRAVWKYRGYRPQPLIPGRVRRWIRQFDRRDRKHIRRLLKNVVYIREKTVKQTLVEQNTALMKRLAKAGLQPHQLIYIQVHDAGSSSAVMLNMLRDEARLEQRGCTLLDSRDVRHVTEKTSELAEGAIIYIDDFIGSGTQLGGERDFTIQYAVGNFAEFVLVPSICEEGCEALEKRGIEIYAGHIHKKVERPLHVESTLFRPSIKECLRAICNQIDPRAPLGFDNMAVMVVLYRNAPDNVPVLLRGSAQQNPYIGVFPRTTDMPVED